MKQGNRLSKNAVWIIMLIIGFCFLIASSYVAVKGIGSLEATIISVALVIIGAILIIIPSFYN